MPITPEYRILCEVGEGIKKSQVIMTYINEDEETVIDELKDKILHITRGEKTFEISINKVLCYGEVNFTNKDDLDVIETFTFLNHLGAVGIKFPYNYDYETHSCQSPRKTWQWTETWSPSTVAKFAHASLGKPERIVLFKTR